MLRALVVVLAMVIGSSAWARQIVTVGGYEFGPFVDAEADGKTTGLTLALIDALNRYQDRFEFRFVLTSPSRRYKDFEDRKFDLIFFESPDWGWTAKKIPVDVSEVFLDGGELYIAKAAAGRGQEYFTDLAGKRMVGILGYHYGFAGFESDPALLASRYRMTLVNDNAASIEMILKDRGDVAVVTDAYLKRYLKSHPGTDSRLLVSDRFDQRYAHRALVRPGAALTVADMDRLFASMAKDQTLTKLWRGYGIKD
ncbi:amino acid ABC transporter substrate-binding protein [Paramagnetospirillum kuznetsovii]|uniref:Amino acid ABC transporter substrate-binding protein n=1 Tax=Paramagnetospirillum kuznetsovii TaxID=2053833 RepID=A0A364NWC3_9PROT|nr:transporter substrate-binding domain-containing protein [Paramagnetospirillum kuznetsovii]RAU21381.1 amino acid ABC transporter substrate-binding protein [Paramagnetospirillum kuznetsovii]